MNNEQALTKIEPMPTVIPEPTTPAALMRRATDVAGICREIVLKTACEIQGRKFVKVEGWESIATAHGCFAGAEDADRVYDNQGNHIGYKAKGVLRNAHGEVIATGEGYVGFDEKDRNGNLTWKNRAEYAGKAMAQTRAISRTCRGVFAHVVVLIDKGLSTTPAEEVPDGGFDDNARAARAKPANVQHGTKTKEPLPEPTEIQRQKWIGLLKPLGQDALDYAFEQGWLLPPTNDFPGEPIEAITLKDVPKTKRQADTILAEIESRMDNPTQQSTEQTFANKTEENDVSSYSSDRSKSLESNPGANLGHSGASFDSEPENDGIETVTGKLEQVSVKEGHSAKGPWKRFGLKIGDLWLSTFDKNLGKCAQQDKNHAVRVQFKRSEKGCDLVSIERAK